MKLEEKDTTVQSTLMLLKGILCITDVLMPLPKEAYLIMKLIFNETTPADYQPPNFKLSSNEKFFFPPNAVKLELGKIRTDFNQYKMFLKTSLSNESIAQIYEESVLNNSQQSKKDVETKQENYNILPQNKTSQSSDCVVSKQHNGGKVQCLCGCKEDSGTKILQCRGCAKKQHSICYGILNSDEVVSKFYCTDCIDDASSNSLKEDAIYGLKEFEENQLSAFRRALVFCASLKQVTAFQLEKGLKCSKKLAKDLITKLEMRGFVTKTGQKYTVNEKKIITQGYETYFQRAMNKENLEKVEPSIEKVSCEANFENQRCKRKLNETTNEEPVQDDCMDFTIEDKVEKLTVSGVKRKHENKLSRQNNLVQTKEKSSEEELQRNPKRRKILDHDGIISFKQKYL